jgi:hypothetical protein
MKPNLLIAILTLATTAPWSTAAAATDRSYYVTELTTQQRFDVYNDGRNTYLESIPGLVVTGATADGERYIVAGVPQQIRGFMNGKPITVVRGFPPAPKPATPDVAAVTAQIKQLTDKLDGLSASAPNLAPAPMIAGAQSPAGVPAAPVAKSSQVFTYQVSPSDQNLRMLVERWSKVVGWNAVWDVERDIPIGTAGQKVGDFRSSVRWLLASTEFGDVVVKPCFYSNSVVRVVRKTVKCNPNE